MSLVPAIKVKHGMENWSVRIGTAFAYCGTWVANVFNPALLCLSAKFVIPYTELGFSDMRYR